VVVEGWAAQAGRKHLAAAVVTVLPLVRKVKQLVVHWESLFAVVAPLQREGHHSSSL
jgi:hypothetical protein